MKKKLLSILMISAASFSLSGLPMAHSGSMCDKDGAHAHGDKKQCSVTGDKKQCDVKKGDKACVKGCAKPCCSTAKTNFGPRKR